MNQEPLAEYLHGIKPKLEAFAERIRQFLEDHITVDPRFGPYYVIKSRVKTFESMEKNILKASQRKDEIGKEAFKMLFDEDRSVDRLMKVVDDLIGVRVVFLFKADVVQLFEDMNAGKLKWFEPKRNKDGSIRAKQFKFDDESATGYTSLHVSGGITKDFFIRQDFVGMTAEIQIRTILEEAWGEPNHYLIYKTSVESKDSDQDSMRAAKGILLQLDNEFDKLHKDFKKTTATVFGSKHLQLAGLYRIDHPEFTPNKLAKYHNEAYRHRLRGKPEDAMQSFVQAQGALNSVGEKAIDELTERSLRNEWRDRLKVDIAHQHLIQGKRGDKGAFKKAETLLKEVIKDNRDHFWANFRLAYVYEKGQALDKAIQCATRAADILDKWEKKNPRNGDCPVPWWDGNAIHADVRAYLAFLYWQKAEESFKKLSEQKKPPSGNWPDDYSAAGAKYGRKAIELALVAEEKLGDVRERGGKYCNCNAVQMRVLNAIIFYSIQMGMTGWHDEHRHVQELYGLASRMPHPLVLDTLGWYEFRRPNGNISEAIELISRAKRILLEAQVDFSRANELKLVSVHYDIILRHANSPYQTGEEYLSWSI